MVIVKTTTAALMAAACLCLAGCPAASVPSAGALKSKEADGKSDQWALLIGVNKYTSKQLGPLRFCGADAYALKRNLCETGGYDAGHVYLLTDFEPKEKAPGDPTIDGLPTKDVIFQKLDQLASQVDGDDTLLVAFSGHGMARGAEGYLIPMDGQPDDLENTALAANDVFDRLKQCDGKKILFVDACHSGGKDGAQAGFDPHVISSEANGFYGLFSCQKDQISQELPELGHGVFTSCLIDGIKGYADANRDRMVTADELYEFVSNRVSEKVSDQFHAKQTPYRAVSGSGASPVISRYETYPYEPKDDAFFTLLSLYGGSWWSETPWLLPYLRPELVNHLSRDLTSPPIAGRDPADANVRLYSHNVTRVYDRLEREFSTYVDTQMRGDPKQQEWLKRMLGWDPLWDAEKRDALLLEGLKIVDDPHTRAMLTLALSQDKRPKPGEGPDAIDPVQELFEKALQAYAAMDPVPSGLRALCLADYAAYLNTRGDTAESLRQLNWARSSLGDPSEAPLFHICCYCNQASILRGEGRYTLAKAKLDWALRIAEEYLKYDDDNENYHPILAHIHERFAWQFMDQWKVAQACSHFQEALKIWQRFEEKTGRGDRATVQILHNKMGLAMANRYSGNTEQALQEFSELVNQVRQARRESSDHQARMALTARLINTYERLVDCNLFRAGGQAEHLADAVDDAKTALYEIDNTPGYETTDRTKAMLLYKLALAEWLRGHVDEAINTVESIVGLELPEDDELLKAYGFAADLIKKFDWTTAVAGSDASQRLEEMFEAFKTSGFEQKLNRDKLDLLLLVCNRLQQSAEGAERADVDAEIAFSIVPKRFVQVEVLPYLRPFFDNAIAAYRRRQQNMDLVLLMRYLWIAKNCEVYDTRGSFALFYYPDEDELGAEAGNGLIVVRRKNGEREVIADLGHSLTAARSARNSGKLTFPEQLAEIQQTEASIIQIVWFDKALWLSNETFPFTLPDAGFRLTPEPE